MISNWRVDFDDKGLLMDCFWLIADCLFGCFSRQAEILNKNVRKSVVEEAFFYYSEARFKVSRPVFQIKAWRFKSLKQIFMYLSQTF